MKTFPALACLLLACRLSAETAVPATLAEYTADPARMAGIVEHVRTPNYGFLVHEKGYLLALHDTEGRILVDRIGDFVLQRRSRDGEGRIVHEHAGWIHDQQVQAKVERRTEEGVPSVRIDIDAPNLDLLVRVLCKPDGPVIDYRIRGIGFPEDDSLSALIGVGFNKTHADTSEVRDVSNPVTLLIPGNRALDIGYPAEVKPYNEKGPGVVTDKGGMRFYPFSGMGVVDPIHVVPLRLTFGFRSME